MYFAAPKSWRDFWLVILGSATILFGIWHWSSNSWLMDAGFITIGIGLFVGSFVMQGEIEAMDLDSFQSLFWLSGVTSAGGLMILAQLAFDGYFGG